MMGRMRLSSLAKPLIVFTLGLLAVHCGRKGDPIPRPRAAARAPGVRLDGLRRLAVTLPTRDIRDDVLAGVDQIRVLYLPLGLTRPTPEEIFSRGQVVLDRRRPDLPGPGGTVVLDLRALHRPAGWIAVVAVRVGEVAGQPSAVLPWLDPAL